VFEDTGIKMTLSDKIFDLGNLKEIGGTKFKQYNGSGRFLAPKDVKEFIKELKERIKSQFDEEILLPPLTDLSLYTETDLSLYTEIAIHNRENKAVMGVIDIIDEKAGDKLT